MTDKDLIDSVRPYTKSGPERLFGMANALRHIDQRGISGDVVECGVWKAGNIILARKLCPDRMCWLYDTFDGMTEPDPEIDVKRNGKRGIDSYVKYKSRGESWSAVSVDEVLSNLAKFGVVGSNITIVKGDVCSSLKQETLLPRKIALLRLDTDWYASTKIELEVLFPRLSIGGILIIDDYGYWMGARKAVDEYFGMDPGFVRVDDTAIMLQKPC